MSLSSRNKNKLMDTINQTFDSIGEATGMRMPKSGNNKEPFAWELFVAKHVLSRAEKRKDAAEKAAVRANVITDKEKNPKPAGTKEVEFNGEIVSIGLEVRSGSERTDVDMMMTYLNGHGVEEELLTAAYKFSTKTTKPAHVFTPILITSEATNNGK